MRQVFQRDPSELILLIRGGDEESLGALYDRFGPPLFAFSLRRLGDPELAEQLVQDVMTRIWRSADRYDPDRGAVETWIFTMARSMVIDLARRQHRSQPLSADPADPGDDLEDLVRAEEVRIALERLTPEHREILHLAYFLALSQSQIADRTGLPLGTVKSRVYYALRAFRLACDELGVEQ